MQILRPMEAQSHLVAHSDASGEDPEEHLHALYAGLTASGRDPVTLRGWLEVAERWRILRALEECEGNRSEAARRLGIGRRTLYSKMERLGIR